MSEICKRCGEEKEKLYRHPEPTIEKYPICSGCLLELAYYYNHNEKADKKPVADVLRDLKADGFFDEPKSFTEIKETLMELTDVKPTSFGSILKRCLVDRGELEKTQKGYIKPNRIK